MDAADWDARYAATDLVWSAAPSVWVEQLVSGMPPGRALDIAAGEGRNALWLVEQGWEVEAVDFSPVAVQRVAALAAGRLGERASLLTAVVGDATALVGEGDRDLVLFCYLHLPREEWDAAIAAGVRVCRPGGTVLVIGHARRNLLEGVGGPQDPAILLDPEHVVASVEGLPVVVERAELRQRVVPDADRPALDTVVLLRRR